MKESRNFSIISDIYKSAHARVYEEESASSNFFYRKQFSLLICTAESNNMSSIFLVLELG